MCICVRGCAHKCSALQDQKRALDFPGAKLQVVVNCLIWRQRTELGYSGRECAH